MYVAVGTACELEAPGDPSGFGMSINAMLDGGGVAGAAQLESISTHRITRKWHQER